MGIDSLRRGRWGSSNSEDRSLIDVARLARHGILNTHCIDELIQSGVHSGLVSW